MSKSIKTKFFEEVEVNCSLCKALISPILPKPKQTREHLILKCEALEYEIHNMLQECLANRQQL